MQGILFKGGRDPRNRERPSLSLPASRGHHSGSTCRGFSSPFESRNRERPTPAVCRYPPRVDITRVLHAGSSLPPLRAGIEREPEFVVTRLAWTSLGFYMQGILGPFESRNRERPSLSLPASRGNDHSGSTCRGFSSSFESRNRERPSLSLPASRGRSLGFYMQGILFPL